MASSTLAIPTSYHQSPLAIQKPTLETRQKVRSEDELLKFFLHGSYDVQRGNIPTSQINENNDKQIIAIQNEAKPADEEKNKSRCMFEETYMINISVKQPDAKPSSKQIDVRIEKALSDTQIDRNEGIDADEVSSIFDEEEVNHEEVDTVIFNEIDSVPGIPKTKLTLADMINKTLTTIPASSVDSLNKLPNNWYVEQKHEIKTRKRSEEIVKKTPSPSIQKTTLTTNRSEDEKLFEYLDYLETKEESNQQSIKSSTTTKPSKTTKIPSKSSPQESIPIIDLEQLCRALTVQDLKDEVIRKKIYELKLLIDERHKKVKSQIPLIKPRKDNLPILIAMPPVVQQRRRTTAVQPTPLLQSKSGQLEVPYNYQDMASNYNPKQSIPPTTQQQYPQRSTNSTRKYHYT